MIIKTFQLLRTRFTRHITYFGITLIVLLLLKVSSLIENSITRLIPGKPVYLRRVYSQPPRGTTENLIPTVMVKHSSKYVIQSVSRTTKLHVNETMAHINPHNYSYVILEKDVCTRHEAMNISLLIGVIVRPSEFDTRNAVRETWGSVVNDNRHVRLIFVFGKTNSSDLQAKINKESDIFHDIIQEDFEDSYQNLTLKSVALLKWATRFCRNALYVLKADADMFINTTLLLNELQRRNYRNSIIGNIMLNSEVVRKKTSKFFTPVEIYKDDFYPTYLTGSMYVVSGDVVSKLYQASLDIPLFVWEDVYINGLCRLKMNVKAVHDNIFPTGEINENCTFTSLAGGYEYSASQLRYIWKRKLDGEKWSKSCYWFPPTHIWKTW